MQLPVVSLKVMNLLVQPERWELPETEAGLWGEWTGAWRSWAQALPAISTPLPGVRVDTSPPQSWGLEALHNCDLLG